MHVITLVSIPTRPVVCDVTALFTANVVAIMCQRTERQHRQFCHFTSELLRHLDLNLTYDYLMRSTVVTMC